nr:tRNA-binding protein [Alteromonas flava]
MENSINWQDFVKVELRAGTIISVEEFPEAIKPAYKLTIDFGHKIGIKRSSAQITAHYAPEDLINKQILAVINFPPKQIGPFMSECLVTGFYDMDNQVVLLSPDMPVENGAKLG